MNVSVCVCQCTFDRARLCDQWQPSGKFSVRGQRHLGKAGRCPGDRARPPLTARLGRDAGVCISALGLSRLTSHARVNTSHNEWNIFKRSM